VSAANVSDRRSFTDASERKSAIEGNLGF